MSWTLDGEPPLDLDDIQGHVLVGFGGVPRALGAFTATDPLAVARIVGDWARDEKITSARTLRPRKGNRAMQFIATIGPWITVSVSVRFLNAIGAPAKFKDRWLDNAQGMRAVSSALNDSDNPWVVGAPEAPVDVLVIAAAETSGAALEIVASFGRQAPGAVAPDAFVEALEPLARGEEHFGFADGLSQPAILGTVDGEPFEPREPDLGGPVPYASPGRDLIWPGHFLFGYPDRNRLNPRQAGAVSSAQDAATSTFALNGSLLVYRRLQQDVAAFRAFCSAHAPAGIDAQMLQARIVGRLPTGLPIASTLADPPADHNDPAYNDFTFLDDAMQDVCPMSAHIRKVNPRLGGSDLDNMVLRLLRRGVPFGPPYVEDEPSPPQNGRGLAFLAYQSSITNQFGRITTEWVNNSTAPNHGGGHDLLIGQIDNPQQNQRIFGVPPQISDDHQTWVIPTGGAFLFTPSVTALRSLDTFG